MNVAGYDLDQLDPSLLKRDALQKIAKALGIRANAKNVELISGIERYKREAAAPTSPKGYSRKSVALNRKHAPDSPVNETAKAEARTVCVGDEQDICATPPALIPPFASPRNDEHVSDGPQDVSPQTKDVHIPEEVVSVNQAVEADPKISREVSDVVSAEAGTAKTFLLEGIKDSQGADVLEASPGHKSPGGAFEEDTAKLRDLGEVGAHQSNDHGARITSWSAVYGIAPTTENAETAISTGTTDAGSPGPCGTFDATHAEQDSLRSKETETMDLGEGSPSSVLQQGSLICPDYEKSAESSIAFRSRGVPCAPVSTPSKAAPPRETDTLRVEADDVDSSCRPAITPPPDADDVGKMLGNFTLLEITPAATNTVSFVEVTPAAVYSVSFPSFEDNQMLPPRPSIQEMEHSPTDGKEFEVTSAATTPSGPLLSQAASVLEIERPVTNLPPSSPYCVNVAQPANLPTPSAGNVKGDGERSTSALAVAVPLEPEPAAKPHTATTKGSQLRSRTLKAPSHFGTGPKLYVPGSTPAASRPLVRRASTDAAAVPTYTRSAPARPLPSAQPRPSATSFNDTPAPNDLLPLDPRKTKRTFQLRAQEEPKTRGRSEPMCVSVASAPADSSQRPVNVLSYGTGLMNIEEGISGNMASETSEWQEAGGTSPCRRTPAANHESGTRNTEKDAVGSGAAGGESGEPSALETDIHVIQGLAVKEKTSEASGARPAGGNGANTAPVKAVSPTGSTDEGTPRVWLPSVVQRRPLQQSRTVIGLSSKQPDGRASGFKGSIGVGGSITRPQSAAYFATY